MSSKLSALELEELDTVIKASKIINKNMNLFNSESIFKSLFIANSGIFKSTTINDDGKERITNFHLPGEIMGLDGIHTDTYQTTCTALSMSSYYEVPYNLLLELSEDIPQIQNNLLKIMSREIYSCKKNHIDLNSKSKLALFIKNISQRFEARGYSGLEFFLPISQRDIANYLGMAEETLSRVFKNLQKQQVVKYKKHTLTILDMGLLTEISEI
jgi:CRP/FNR family transcriptional regulator